MTKINIEKILKSLPHRYPLLLVDKVIELETNKKIIAIKNVTFNEPHFLGHFPNHPIMPGVLIIEALFSNFQIFRMTVTELAEVQITKFLNPIGSRRVDR